MIPTTTPSADIVSRRQTALDEKSYFVSKPLRYVVIEPVYNAGARKWGVRCATNDIVGYKSGHPTSYGVKFYDTQTEQWMKAGKTRAVPDRNARPQYREIPNLDDLADSWLYEKTVAELEAIAKERDDEFSDFDRREHEAAVESALALGKSVRLAVLFDYPNLSSKYSDDQARDDSGRWTDGGGGGSTGDASDASSAAQDLYTAATGSETGITGAIKDAVSNNGGEVHGLEHRIKTADSLARKIESDAKVKNISAKDAAAQINDALRYTGVYPASKFTDGAQKTLDDLRAKGYTVNRVKQFWGDDSYRGTNVKLTGPDGHVFELQFHTPASFKTKVEESHALYEKLRASKSPAERTRYGAKMKTLWKSVIAPLHWASLKHGRIF